jgi:hypothetical protein
MEPKPPAPARDWELYLGSYLGPRIAIVVLATAAVFFLAYALKEWGPFVRVAIGYAVAAALFIAGYFVEKKHRDYARVLYSGGFLLSYFVTYAAHFIEGARIIHNEYVGWTLLTLVVAAWAVAVQWRRSRSMAYMVVALAHLTILLSGPAPNSAFAIMLLSAGAAFFLLWNRWYYVAAVGLVGSYVNQTLWMVHHLNEDTPKELAIGLSLLVAHFLIFALSELFAREEVRRQTVPTWFRSVYVTLNSAVFLGLAYIGVGGFDFARDHRDLLLFSHALVLILIGLGYLHLRKGDPLYNTYLTKGIAVATMGLGLRYGGSRLATWLSVETVVLLVSARRSGLVVIRVLALAVGAVALYYGLLTFVRMEQISFGVEGYWPRAVEAAMAVMAFLAASQLYQRTDWDRRSPRGDTLDPETRDSLWSLGFLSEPSHPGMRRPLEGLVFPYAYAIAAFLFYLFAVWKLTEPGYRTLAMALPALVLTAITAWLGSRPFGLIAVSFVAVAAVIGTREFTVPVTGRRGASVPVATVALQALALTAIFSEKILGGSRQGLLYHRTQASPYFLYAVPGWLLGLVLVRQFPQADGAVALIASGVILAIVAQWLHPRALAMVSTALLFWALCVVADTRDLTDEISPFWRGATWTLLLLPLPLDRFYKNFIRRMRMIGFDWALLALSWLALLHAAFRDIPEDWAYFTLALGAYAYLGYGLAFRSVPGGVASLAAAALASLLIVIRTYMPQASALPTSAVVLTYTALAAYCVLLERLSGMAVLKREFWPRREVRNACVAVATALLVLMLARVPAIREHWLTVSWAALAFALFGTAVAFRGKPYRFAALGVIALALGRAYTIDAWRLTGLTRVAAFVALFVVMMPIGYAYLRLLKYLRAFEEEENSEPNPPKEQELP